MRIRKRPLSHPPPLHLSDPRPIQPSPMVQLPRPSSPKSAAPLLLQRPPDDTTALTASLSDHPRPLPAPMAEPDDAGDSSVIVVESKAHDHHAELDRSDETQPERDGGGRGGGKRRNDTGKGVVFGSETFSKAVIIIPSSPSHGDDGKWCDEEKAIPPKKRKGRGGDYMMMMNTRESSSNNSKKMKTRMKTKMNKKCTQKEEATSEEEEEEEEEEERKEEANTSNKKRGRGSVVMEGSRCSRVNGRGWRCCQQTLVGYSLCEHHLGKGRLRSINRSIPSATVATKNNDSLSEASSSSPEKKTKYDSSGIHNDDEKDEKKPAVIMKKRMKLGMVKARSLSSLLGRTDTLVTLPENNKERGERWETMKDVQGVTNLFKK